MSQLSLLDWGVFALSLVVPILLTVGLALCSSSTSTSQFLMADRSMSPVPVALSLAVSYLSAVTISGVPSEVAYHSTLFPWTLLLAATISLLVIPNLFIPVFHKMRLTSVYEYLELRYCSRLLRRLGSLTFVVSLSLYIGVALYAPCNSLAVVSGLPVWIFILGGGLLSVFIGTLGGLRTVVWIDAWQALVMMGGLSAIITLGLSSFGWEEVWRIGVERGRIQLVDWSIDPTVRSTSLAIFSGQLIQWGAIYGCHQTQVQRYCSIKTVGMARCSLIINVLVFWIINLGAIIAGLVIFTQYSNCDPLATGDIEKMDQLTTYYVTQRVTAMPGMAGLFISALVCGALSSLSSAINSLAAVIWEDFLALSCLAKNAPESQKLLITRIVAAQFGVLATALAFGFSQMDGVLEVAATSFGVISGPLLAIFLLGFFSPVTNKIGASVGMLSGHGVTLWIAAGHFYQQWSGEAVFQPTLNTSTTACPNSLYNINSTETHYITPSVHFQTADSSQGDLELLYSISYQLYPVVGFLVAMVVAVTVSLISQCCHTPRPPPPPLLHPWVRPKTEANHSNADTDHRWMIEQDTHYRWPSPSLPPTLKKPRPSGGCGPRSVGVVAVGQRTLDRLKQCNSGFNSHSNSGPVLGFNNQSFDETSESGSYLQGRNSPYGRYSCGTNSSDGFYNSRL